MTHLPISADSLDHLYANRLPSEYRLFSDEQNARVKALFPKWQNAGFLALNGQFPYMAAWYQTPSGWLVTSRRHVPVAIDEITKAVLRPARLLSAAACWEALTPADAFLDMLTERMKSGELTHDAWANITPLSAAQYA